MDHRMKALLRQSRATTVQLPSVQGRPYTHPSVRTVSSSPAPPMTARTCADARLARAASAVGTVGLVGRSATDADRRDASPPILAL